MPSFHSPIGPKSKVWLKPDAAGPGVVIGVCFPGFGSTPKYWIRWPGKEEATAHWPHEITTEAFKPNYNLGAFAELLNKDDDEE